MRYLFPQRLVDYEDLHNSSLLFEYIRNILIRKDGIDRFIWHWKQRPPGQLAISKQAMQHLLHTPNLEICQHKHEKVSTLLQTYSNRYQDAVSKSDKTLQSLCFLDGIGVCWRLTKLPQAYAYLLKPCQSGSSRCKVLEALQVQSLVVLRSPRRFQRILRATVCRSSRRSPRNVVQVSCEGISS
jgi:hypothetical protein